MHARQFAVLILRLLLCSLAISIALWPAQVLFGQRVQFPSPVNTTPGNNSLGSAIPGTSANGSLPYVVSQPLQGGPTSAPMMSDPYSLGTPSTAPISPPTATMPYGTTQPIYPTTPTPIYPTQPPTVGSQQPGALYPSDFPFTWQQGTYSYQAPDGTMTQFQRFVQNIGFEHTWLPVLEENDKKLGIHKSEIWSTFGLPLFYNTQTPLRVTPGFAVSLLEGPVSEPVTNPLDPAVFPADLPPRLFDAYLDGSWEPSVNEWLSGDLGARIGVYSDFSHVTTDSIRYMGRGLGVLSFTPTIKVALGVWYIDRNHIKLLPAGGVIWTPNPDTNFRILFPNPKLAHRFTTVGTAEWWWYFTGEYGGGSWTIRRDKNVNPSVLYPGGIESDNIDYNDMRISFGLEWIGQRGIRGHIEAGYVWDREILYDESKSPKSFKPDDTIMVRAGIDY
ncbi:MAG: hypothetical protein JW829_00665 [Pirellulales bacterium]|nr:hypothetical protein [Pirellulales bacterium]